MCLPSTNLQACLALREQRGESCSRAIPDLSLPGILRIGRQQNLTLHHCPQIVRRVNSGSGRVFRDPHRRTPLFDGEILRFAYYDAVSRWAKGITAVTRSRRSYRKAQWLRLLTRISGSELSEAAPIRRCSSLRTILQC